MPRAVAVLVVCVLSLCGCGGGGEPAARKPAPTPDPTAQLRAAAEKVLSTQDGYAVCYELASERFIRAVFKDKDKCTNLRKVLGPGDPKAVDVAIAGNTADATMRYENGAVAGEFGTLSFVREGKAWKLDKLDDAFMHSAFEASMQVFTTGALAVPEVQRCMAARGGKMSDAAVRSYVYQLFRSDPKAGRTAVKIAEQCPEQLAIYVAEELTDIWRQQGKSEKFLDCAQRELEGLIMLTGVAKYALKGGASDAGGFSSAIFVGLMSGVQKHCRKP
jgi:hypothetical protein